jgi:hypothetical protein
MTYVVRNADGAITVTDAVLASIVVQSAESVEGARVRRARRKVDIELHPGTRSPMGRSCRRSYATSSCVSPTL